MSQLRVQILIQHNRMQFLQQITQKNKQRMTITTTLINLLATIQKYSNRIRARLNDYGFSRQECDQLFCQLLTEDQQSDYYPSETYNGSTTEKGSNVAKFIALGMRKSGAKAQHYLLSIIGKLEVQLSQLEEYEKLEQKLLQLNSISSISEQQEQKSEKKTSIKSISDASSEEAIPVQQKSVTEDQGQLSRLQRQEMAIKSSLKTMMDRTRILRTMLQREILLRSMNQMEELSYVPASRFVSLGGFAM